MTQPANTEYTVEVHDLGHIPPYDSKPRWNRRLLQRHGWRETNERPEGFTDTRRLFWYQHGDVLLVVDDTSLLAVIIPSHARRRDTRTIRPTVESLMDWKKSSGRKRLVELKQASHRTVIACRGVDLTRIIAGMVLEMLAEQNELLGAVIYQHPIRYRGGRICCYSEPVSPDAIPACSWIGMIPNGGLWTNSWMRTLLIWMPVIWAVIACRVSLA